MKKEKSVGLLELQKEKAKLEGDRAVLGERLQALNAEREKSTQQLIESPFPVINSFDPKEQN